MSSSKNKSNKFRLDLSQASWSLPPHPLPWRLLLPATWGPASSPTTSQCCLRLAPGGLPCLNSLHLRTPGASLSRFANYYKASRVILTITLLSISLGVGFCRTGNIPDFCPILYKKLSLPVTKRAALDMNWCTHYLGNWRWMIFVFWFIYYSSTTKVTAVWSWWKWWWWWWQFVNPSLSSTSNNRM